MPTFSPAFLDELRARTPLQGLIGRRMRLARSGRHWKGCCPFHGEKTPSFYVYDDHFHCFGCGAHGDAVSFVMQMDGTPFPDAVASLASEAGLSLPAERAGSAEASAARDERGRLHAALEAAAALFEQLLRDAPDASEARATLARRGIGADAIGAFRLGWSGGGAALRPALVRAGHAAETLRDAGLLHVGEDGAIRGEMFRNRITFPITDRKGRVCGFGARALGDAQPKYLNGPETAVFSKRRLLYGQHRAATRLRRRSGPDAAPVPPLVLAEGYMDVIALDEAGLAAAAPLGTALGEEQLEEAWRLDPAPVLCLDGDAAGRRAARRAVERALPLLAPERTLRLATLEEGEDPDSLLRRHGAAALRARIDAARPLSAALYDLLEPPRADATPEQRAQFRQRLLEAAAAIPDKGLAAEYRRTLLDRYFAAAKAPRPPRGPMAARRGAPPAAGVGAGRTPPTRPALSEASAREEQAAHLALIAAHNPRLIHDVEDAWHRLVLPGWLATLREAVIEAAGMLDSDDLVNHLRTSGAGPLLARATELVRRTGALGESAQPGAMPATAEAGWWHFFGLIQHARLDDEISLAKSLLEQDITDARQSRLIALIEARAKLTMLENDVAF